MNEYCTEAVRGNLAVFKVGRRHFTTLAAVKEMIRAHAAPGAGRDRHDKAPAAGPAGAQTPRVYGHHSTDYTSDWPLAEWLSDEGRPPDPDYYRPWKDEDATWFQVWETVSEGTPVTPPFATKEELVDYLATKGDFWDQRRGDGPWVRTNAEAFVGSGWAPTLMVKDGVISAPRDGGHS